MGLPEISHMLSSLDVHISLPTGALKSNLAGTLPLLRKIKPRVIERPYLQYQQSKTLNRT